ncbi:MAG: isocitrate lyase/phosphoenolpyruvate mutase family protein [Candidatus Eisenbacteria bacterium]
MTENEERQKRKASDFLALHHAPEVLILPNVWDVVSAKIFELERCRAIGTTSAGIAATLGYADGQRMSLAENLEVVRRIATHTALPVSADIEAAYDSSVEGAAKAARAAWDAGAVGVNLEDGSEDPAAPLFDTILQQERIRAMRNSGAADGVHLVINARTDAFMVIEDPSKGLRQSIDRGNTYMEAGADCVFVPDLGNLDKKAIALLVTEIAGPVNIIAGATTPSIAELQDLGVARVSVGPRPMRAVLSRLKEIARELLSEGTYRRMSDSTISYSEVNRWFDERPGRPQGGSQ